MGLNAPNLLSTYEYSKFSTRSASELKFDSSGLPKEKTTGLDYDYITQYSSGIFESLNIVIPRIQGGASREDVGTNSNLYKFLMLYFEKVEKKQLKSRTNQKIAFEPPM